MVFRSAFYFLIFYTMKKNTKTPKKTQELAPLESGLKNFWGDFGNFPFFSGNLLPELKIPKDLSPRTEILEKKQEFTVDMELPGFKAKDLALEIEDNSLIVSGERTETAEKKTGKVLRSDLSSKSVYQRINFANSADLTKAKSTFKDGLLEIKIPKRKISPRQTIKIGG